MPHLPITSLSDPVSAIPLIGPSHLPKLKKLGIVTVENLLHHYPFRHYDAATTATIATCQEGETVSLTGTVLFIKNSYLRSGKTMQRGQFSDGTGILTITWFNQPFLVKTFTAKPHLAVSGTIKKFGNQLTLSSPQYEFITTSANTPLTTKQLAPKEPSKHIHTNRLVPIYPETAGISSKWLRSRIHWLLSSLPHIPDWLPTLVSTNNHLITLDQALRQIHFPDNITLLNRAKARLEFDELFTYQLIAHSIKQSHAQLPNAYPISYTNQLQTFLKQIPFTLTPDQDAVTKTVLADMNGPHPMNRLIQGDVGSGKTVIAAAAAYVAATKKVTTIIMAPTQVLAKQHYHTFIKWLKPLGCSIGLVTAAHKHIPPHADIIIGTHALLHKPLPLNCGLVIIDEQHRFGVNQRNLLINQDSPPHLLTMTATPIPRTIALTLYSHLDISVITTMPPGRKPVKTWVIPAAKRQASYHWLEEQVHAGHQVYIVCPLINPSEHDQLSHIKAAETEYETLSKSIFPNLRLGLIHGGCKPADKNKVLEQFHQGNIDILVATPVIEVGIDISNATVMVIEAADRFGLASLHQLRGRVGRSHHQSYCLLFPGNNNPTTTARLKHLETVHSGLKLAEIDLKLRGPGDLFGTKQSGYIDLKIASLNNLSAIEMTHQAAEMLLGQDPHLSKHPTVKQRLIQHMHLLRPN